MPSVGGHSCCESTGGSQGPYDQNAVEERPDVLVYTSAALNRATQLTGPMTVSLYARSTAPDTDWTAKVDVVRTDVERRLVSAREGMVAPLTPGTPTTGR